MEPKMGVEKQQIESRPCNLERDEEVVKTCGRGDIFEHEGVAKVEMEVGGTGQKSAGKLKGISHQRFKNSNEKFKAQKLSNPKNINEGNKETREPISTERIRGGNKETERLIPSERTCGG
jgi:hypothetical protein